jgi:hypothetical protein
MGINGKACEENVLKTIDPDLCRVYQFPRIIIN